MPKLIILISILCLLVATAARWWFWRRVQAQGRRVRCGITAGELATLLGVSVSKKHQELRDAAALGGLLRRAGLQLLVRDGEKLAKSRQAGWWNLRLLPALVAALAAASLISKKASFQWVISLGLLIIAGHVLIRVAGLSVELAAVDRGWREFQKHRRLRRMDEENMMLKCAKASVWDTILPW